jgi:hypothetical protein
MKSTASIVWKALACALLLCSASWAQNVYGTLTGRVLDPSGASIPGASVAAINVGTNARFPATSSSDGFYTLPGLPVGVYDLSVEAQGFQNFTVRGIRLQVNESIRVDATLPVGTSTETVNVIADSVVVDTISPTLKAVVDQKRIEELPLNGRNATQLMRLVVGTSVDTRTSVTSGTTYPGVTGVSVNGGRANTTNFMLDGSQNNDHYTNVPNPMPNPDALQEFSVQTNSFSAEFGRQSGGIVNAVTKSGTNEVHGSAFWFVRNKAMNATPYFGARRADGRRADDGLKRNQFGATLGGPVYIPKFYDGRNKSFFLCRIKARWSAARRRRTFAWCPRLPNGTEISQHFQEHYEIRLVVAHTRTTRFPYRRSVRFRPRSSTSFQYQSGEIPLRLRQHKTLTTGRCWPASISRSPRVTG